MALASGSRHDIAYVAEVTPGTTPGTPAMKRLRYTGTTLNLTKDALTSEEMRADRQITDLRHGNKRVGGDISFELSYGAFDDWLESALQAPWATNVLKAGTTKKFFSVERRFADVSQYLRYLGVIVNTMSLIIRPNALVTGSFGVIGINMGPPSSTALGVPTDVATNPPYDSFSGALLEGGISIANITSIDINLDNGMDPAFVIGSPLAAEIFSGRSNLTGTISAFFENTTLLNKFLNETETSISLTLEGVGGDLNINIPRLKYSGGDLPVNSTGGITMNLPFQALRDNTAASNLVITRTPGP